MNLGNLLIQFAFLLAVLSGVWMAPVLWGQARGWAARAASWMFVLHAAATMAAFALLATYFMGHRFEFDYVARFSSRSLSPALSLASSWAGQEGSILLWAAFTALLGLALLRQPGSLVRPALPFVSLMQAFLLGLLLVRSPFAPSAVIPTDGQGLNPLLEDPWMVVHPPVLFLGYAALAIPFALAVAALLRREHKEWNRMVWPWALFGVVTLGTGIVLGGVWAYKVLGWGGYWGWDPVENASLIPWLVAIALLHGLLIQRTTGSLVRTNLILAALAWVTVLGGTYLTRSGILQDFSVHSFTDSGINGPLVAFLLVSLLIPTALIAGRWRTIADRGRPWATLSRESALWLGLVTVLVLAGLVAFGTSAPVLTGLAGKPAGVQPEFYKLVSLPMGLVVVLLMALAPALRWSRQAGRSWLHALVPGFIAGGATLVVALLAGVRQPSHVALAVTTGLALGVNAVTTARLFRRGWAYGAGALGHVGVAIMVLGMVAAGSLGRTARLRLEPGVPAEALGYRVTYHGAKPARPGEQVLALSLDGKGGRYEMTPRLVELPQEGKMRTPALARAGELYLSPLDVEKAPAAREPVWLDKGVERVIGGVGYTFAGFRVVSHDDMKVFADVAVRRDRATTTISPGIQMGAAGREALLAEVPGLGPMTVERIDADHKRVAVALPATGAPTGAAVVELSTKPFVNLVWIGALMALLGSSLAGLRRATETAPARAAAAAALQSAR